MKVLIAGADWHDNLLQMVEAGFRENGHQTKIFRDDDFKNLSLFFSRAFNNTPFLKCANYFFKKYQEKVTNQLFQAINNFNPDFVFIAASLKFSGKMIREIRGKTNIPIAYLLIDDPAFYHRTLFHDMSFFSRVFVIDRSWMPDLELMNPGNIFYLPHSGNHLKFKPLNMEKDIDIAFAGNVSLQIPSAPAGFFRASILNFLASHGFKIKAFLPGISEEVLRYFPHLEKIDYSTKYGLHGEINELYNRSKIALSIFGPHVKDGLTPRIFDTALSGTFQVVQHKKDAEELFPKCVAVFKTKKELLGLVKYYLENVEEREMLAQRTYRLALKNHTFKSRAQKICQVIK